MEIYFKNNKLKNLDLLFNFIIMNLQFDSRYGKIIQHKASGFNLDDVANELSINKQNIVKAIILESKDLDPIVCVIRAVDRLNNRIIKKEYSKNYSFMSEENLLKINLSPGAIPPFIGFELKFKTYIDTNLSFDETYYGSGGSVYSACEFRISNYIQLGAKLFKLSKD